MLARVAVIRRAFEERVADLGIHSKLFGNTPGGSVHLVATPDRLQFSHHHPMDQLVAEQRR